MRTYPEQKTNYDVTGGTTEFGRLPHEGEGIMLELQIFYTDLSQNDNKIVLQDSLDGINWHDAEDSSGTVMDVILLKAAKTAMLRIVGFSSKYIRAKFLEGTTGTGTIDKIMYMMQ